MAGWLAGKSLISLTKFINYNKSTKYYCSLFCVGASVVPLHRRLALNGSCLGTWVAGKSDCCWATATSPDGKNTAVLLFPVLLWLWNQLFIFCHRHFSWIRHSVSTLSLKPYSGSSVLHPSADLLVCWAYRIKVLKGTWFCKKEAAYSAVGRNHLMLYECQINIANRWFQLRGNETKQTNNC